LESAERVDLLFADVIMPGKLDGYDLARIALERWPSIKVVLTSGFPGTNVDRDPVAKVPLLNKPYRRASRACSAAPSVESSNQACCRAVSARAQASLR
jgi:CheY-like chemotaxis protein